MKTAHPTIKEITSSRTIALLFSKSSSYARTLRGVEQLREVEKLVAIYVTPPVASAIAEHSFSSLRRTKTYLRSSMTASQLNNLFLLYPYSHLTEDLDLVAVARDFVTSHLGLVGVAREFVSPNSRCQKYVGHF